MSYVDSYHVCHWALIDLKKEKWPAIGTNIYTMNIDVIVQACLPTKLIYVAYCIYTAAARAPYFVFF